MELFEIKLPPLQGLKLQSVFIHSALHHAIANALSEQQVSNIYNNKYEYEKLLKIG